MTVALAVSPVGSSSYFVEAEASVSPPPVRPCAGCGQPVTTPLVAPLRFLIAADRRQRGDVDPETDTDVVLLKPKDTGADLTPLVRDALLLAVPLPRCGAAACAAGQRVAFETGGGGKGPWGQLAGLRAKLK